MTVLTSLRLARRYSFSPVSGAPSCLLPVGIACALLAGPAISQPVAPQVPNAGTVFRELQQTLPPVLRTPEPALTPAPASIPTLGGGPTLPVPITVVELAGTLPAGVEASEVSRLLRSRAPFDRLDDLKALAAEIQAYVRAQGYPLAQVSVPAQEITQGTVRLLLTVGQLDGRALAVNGQQLRIREDRLREYFAPIAAPEQAFRQTDVERKLLLINDLPGIQARLQLAPGSAPGLVSASLQAQEGPALSGYVLLDNFGNDETGRYRVTAAAYWNDPTRVGDQLGATLIATNERLLAGKLDYLRPIGTDGLMLGASLLKSDFRLGGNLVDLGIRGDTLSAEATLAYPLVRQARSNLWVGAGLARREFTTEMTDVTDEIKRVQVGRAGLRGDRIDDLGGGGFWRFNLTGHAGQLVPIQGMSITDSESFSKWTFGVARNQRIADGWSIYASWSGQRTRDLLDGSERFLLGGVGAVRAYSNTAIAADSADLFTLEVRHELGAVSTLGNLQAVAFYDMGRTPQDPQFELQANRIQGAGVALALTRAGRFQAVLTYAHRIGQSTSGLLTDDRTNGGRLWFSLLAQF